MIKLSEHRLQTACLLFITAVLAAFAAYWLRPVLVPLVVAVFVVSGVTPILEFLERSIASSRFTAAVIAFLVGALLINLLAASLWASLIDLRENMQAYHDSYQEIRDQFGDLVPGDGWHFFGAEENQRRRKNHLPANNATPETLENTESDVEIESEEPVEPNAVHTTSQLNSDDSNDFNQETDSGAASTPDASNGEGEVTAKQPTADTENRPEADSDKNRNDSSLGNTPRPQVDEFPEEENVLDTLITNTITRGFSDISQAFLELMSTSVIVLIYVFFLMLGVPTESDRPKILNDIDHQIRSYLSLKTIISVFTGLAFGLALWFFDIPMALAFGMMAIFLNFIPNIGPIIASLLPIPLIILHPGGNLLWVVLVILVTSGIQFISGNVIEPRLMGKSSDLHPIVVLVALMFWGMLWGIVGMFLAVPITSGIRIALSEFEQTKGVAEVMAGRWPKEIFPLSPTEVDSPELPA